MQVCKLSRQMAALGVAACIGSASFSQPIAVTCIRDQKDDPAKIGALFGQVDRMEAGKLSDANVHFYLADRGFVAVDEFVYLLNFHNGREDPSPLRIGATYRLKSRRPAGDVGSYVVETTRSAWFERGSGTDSSYTETSNVWLVSFQGCEIRTIREAPELSYLIDNVAR